MVSSLSLQTSRPPSYCDGLLCAGHVIDFTHIDQRCTVTTDLNCCLRSSARAHISGTFHNGSPRRRRVSSRGVSKESTLLYHPALTPHSSLRIEDAPTKLRCATCNKLATNAVKLPCCDQSICERCMSLASLHPFNDVTELTRLRLAPPSRDMPNLRPLPVECNRLQSEQEPPRHCQSLH